MLASGDLLGSSQAEFYTDYGIDAICDSSAIDGYVLHGAPTNHGSKVGAITDLTFSDCIMFEVLGGMPVLIEMDGTSQFDVVTTSNVMPGDPLPVQITGVVAYLRTTGSAPYTCELHARGSIDAVIYPGTTANGHDAELEITRGFSLQLEALDGNGNPTAATCFGQIYTGDQAEMFADFSINAVDPTLGPITH